LARVWAGRSCSPPWQAPQTPQAQWKNVCVDSWVDCRVQRFVWHDLNHLYAISMRVLEQKWLKKLMNKASIAFLRS
jgi:hypothetical protein